MAEVADEGGHAHHDRLGGDRVEVKELDEQGKCRRVDRQRDRVDALEPQQVHHDPTGACLAIGEVAVQNESADGRDEVRPAKAGKVAPATREHPLERDKQREPKASIERAHNDESHSFIVKEPRDGRPLGALCGRRASSINHGFDPFDVAAMVPTQATRPRRRA